MDSGKPPCPDEGGLNQVTSGSVEKMKNRRKQQKLANQPKKPKLFKSDKKKFKLNKNRRLKSAKLVDLKAGDELNEKLTNKFTDKLTEKLTGQLSEKLTNKLNGRLNGLPDKPGNEKKEVVSVKEVVAVAAGLLLKSIANQTAHKTKCSLLSNLLASKPSVKLTKDKLTESKFSCPNSLTINHQPLIAMFGGQNSNDKIEGSINLKDADDFSGDKISDKLGDKFSGGCDRVTSDRLTSDKLNKMCHQEEHNNCLNSNETHQIVISLLERLIDQQQSATDQLMQLNQQQNGAKKTTKKRNNERRKRLNKIKNQLNGLEMVKNFVQFYEFWSSKFGV